VAKASRSSSNGFNIDTRELKSLARELRALGPEVTRSMRVGVREMLEVVRAEAARRSDYSHRIPGSLRVRVSARGLSGSVYAGGAKAPDAAPIENRGKGHVRHPIFIPKAKLPGPPGSWTAVHSHEAFLSPALEAKSMELEEMTDALLERIIEEFCRE
jgi:hypothetical protein